MRNFEYFTLPGLFSENDTHLKIGYCSKRAELQQVLIHYGQPHVQ